MTDQEFARQRALDRYRILDTLPDATYDDVVRLASILCETPVALITLLDRDRQWFKAQIGIDERQSARELAFCEHAIRTPDRLTEVADLRGDPRFADNPYVTGDFAARFYAGMPLVTPDGAALGTVCVVDHRPRELSARQREALGSLARLTMALLDARQRELTLQRDELLHGAAAAPAQAPAGFTVAILELQDFAGVVARLGERATHRLLDRLDHDFAQCLQREAGDVIDRVTGSVEFIAVLHGDADGTLQRLRDTADRHGLESGIRLLLAAAAADRGDEPLPQVYLRADEALSREKDRLGA